MSTVVHAECRCRHCDREWVARSEVATVGHSARALAFWLDRLRCVCGFNDPGIAMLRFTRLPVDVAWGAPVAGAQGGVESGASTLASGAGAAPAVSAVARRPRLAQ